MQCTNIQRGKRLHVQAVVINKGLQRRPMKVDVQQGVRWILLLVLSFASFWTLPVSEALLNPASSSSSSLPYCGNIVPILFDSSNHLHRSIEYHPEQPARIEACVKALQAYPQEVRNGDKQRTFDLIDVAAAEGSDDTDQNATTSRISQHPMLPDELDRARDVLLSIHSPDVVTNLEQRCRESRQRRIQEGKDPLGFVGYVDDDTYVTTETYGVCLRATATWMRAVDWIHSYQQQRQQQQQSKSSSISNPIPMAMALTRPPGHHATATMSNGFCLFNFAAAAATHFQSLFSSTASDHTNPSSPTTTPKISILDWDVHYGQGVADIVSQHPESMRYASIHQVPAFPYMGTQRGRQPPGNILTIPMTADTTWTCGYQQYLHEALDFLLANEEEEEDNWDPDLVIVCAGYDALDSEELASVSLNANDYGKMTRALLAKIRQSSKPTGLLLGLEGGYQLGHMAGGGNLQQAVVETVKALIEDG